VAAGGLRGKVREQGLLLAIADKRVVQIIRLVPGSDGDSRPTPDLQSRSIASEPLPPKRSFAVIGR
jgi:hypothetical protein